MIMKIFNWMPRRLHQVTDYCRVSHKNSPDVFNDEKSGTSFAAREPKTAMDTEIHTETEALLLHQVLGGILTIGTLGHAHPLLPTYYPANDHQEPIHDDQQEEPSADREEEHHNSTGSGLTPAQLLQVPPPVNPGSSIQEEVIKPSLQTNYKEVLIVVEAENSLQPLLKEEDKAEYGRDRERTTLADLFAANPFSASVVVDKPPAHEITRPSKHGKKLAHRKKEDGSDKPTAKKLQRLITRMLGKKVHPAMARRDEEELMHVREGTIISGGL